jgi:hypothetical protein
MPPKSPRLGRCHATDTQISRMGPQRSSMGAAITGMGPKRGSMVHMNRLSPKHAPTESLRNVLNAGSTGAAPRRTHSTHQWHGPGGRLQHRGSSQRSLGEQLRAMYDPGACACSRVVVLVHASSLVPVSPVCVYVSLLLYSVLRQGRRSMITVPATIEQKSHIESPRA